MSALVQYVMSRVKRTTAELIQGRQAFFYQYCSVCCIKTQYWFEPFLSISGCIQHQKSMQVWIVYWSRFVTLIKIKFQIQPQRKKCKKRQTADFWQTLKYSSLMTEDMWVTGTENTNILQISVTELNMMVVFCSDTVLTLPDMWRQYVCSAPAQEREDKSLDHFVKLNVVHILLILVLFW